MAAATGMPTFASVADYRAGLADLGLWTPVVHKALRSAGLRATDGIRIGDIGTFPVFLTDTGLAVKFYGERFDGPGQFRAETQAYQVLAGRGLPVPELVAAGGFGTWSYVITTLVPGIPYSRFRAGASAAQRLAVAAELGDLVRRLNALPLPESGELRPDYGRFLAMLAGRRRDGVRDQLAWGHLPAALCHRLDGLLPDPADLVAGPPIFVHADLHADHVFVDRGGSVCGLIDFADAYAGTFEYELVTLHLGSFGADMALLREFLTAYGRPAPDSRLMLAWTLLHECDVLADVRHSIVDVADYDELADRLWG